MSPPPPLLNRRLSLSPSIIEKCIDIIKGQNDIDLEEDCGNRRLAALFYEKMRLDLSKNQQLSPRRVAPILEGKPVPELRIREFLFLLRIIPTTDPENGIEAFFINPPSLPKPSCLKHDGPVIFSKKNQSIILNQAGTASLSQDALDAINQIFETDAFRRKKTPIIRAHKPDIQDHSIKSFFRKRPTDKYIFRDILEALVAAGLVSLEQGTTLEDMLDIPATSKGPYVLDQQSFVMGTRGVSLSDDAARYIRETLIEKGLSNIEIARTLGMHKNTISGTLNAKPRDRKTLNTILQYLINIGVVCLEKGQTLESLLAKKPEPSYKVPNAAQDITEGCMGSSSQSLSAFALAVVQQAQEWVKS